MRLRKWVSYGLTAALVAGNIAAAGVMSGDVYADESFAKSLVAQLKFDGNLKDAAGGGHDGTSNKDVEYTEGVDGKAIHLKDSTYIDLGKNADLQPENLTASMWVKADGNLTGENILTWFKPSGNYQGKGWYLSSLDDNTPLKISIGESGGQPMEAYVSASRSAFFPDGEWVHIAVTFDKSSQSVQIFRNGVAQEVLYLNTSSYITPDETSNKYIGFNSPGYNGGFAKVYLDDFRVYDSAASAGDIIELYTEFGAEFDTASVLEADVSNLKLSVASVKYNMVLPTEGNAGSTITWKSSNETVLKPDGTVTRPAIGEADEKVTLTAVLEFGGSRKEKSFEVTVPALTDFSVLSDFALSDVELLDEYLTNAQNLEIKYLKSFEADRLLKGFAEQAGVKTDAALYGGWENSAIKGHTLGHYLTAVSQAYAATGDEELSDILNYMIDRLAEYQQESGYLAAIPESHYTQIENGNTSGTWVPWYTMHKVLAGIVDVYEATGNEKALDTASKLGDWVYGRTSKWTDETQAKVLGVEYGGMNDCLYQLYSHTGSEKHLAAAHAFDEMKLFEALYNGEDVLDGLHANTTIPKIVGALNRYITVTDDKDREYYLRVAENFWEIVINNHTYITGGNSEWEHFGKAGILDAERTNCNCETCNTYNMLKLTRELYKITGEAKYSDYYENTFINAILSSQNPETGMTTYFQPMATGFYKVYSSEFNHFWCCTGSGMENFSKLGDSLYYHNDKDLYVIQFFSSTVTWKDKNIALTQETDIPETDVTKLTVKTIDGGTSEAGIKVRVPDWASGTPEVSINGEKQTAVVSGGVIALGNSWKNGDVIEIRYPMETKVYSLPDNDSVIAFKYGPVVLSASLGTENMTDSTTGVNVTVPTRNNITIDEDIAVTDGTVEEWLENAASNVVKADGKLEFTLKGTDSGLVFTPHYKQHTDRYGIYFYMTAEGDENAQAAIVALKEKNRLEAATLDSVPVSNDQYELQHEMKAQNSSTGSFGGLMYRDAAQGGYFQYVMKTDGNSENILSVKYYSGDAGRTFTIYADDKKVTDVTLEKQEEEGFYEAEYKIPTDITKGKSSITVKFAADRTGYAGGVFDRIVMRRAYTGHTTFDDVTVDGDSVKDDIEDSEITAYVDESKKEVNVKFDITDDYGLLYIDGNAVDDTKEQKIKLSGDTTEIKVKVMGEDHKTSKEYTFKIIKGEKPNNSVILVVVLFVSAALLAGVVTFFATRHKGKKTQV